MSDDRGAASRTALFTVLALTGFAANSLLCRAALRSSAIDAASFTTLRLVSGAIVLTALVRGRAARSPRDERRALGGSVASAAALFAYAAAFSFAYIRLDTGTGALLLFGAVQITMVGWGVHRGERPRAVEWLGLVAALGGLVLLTFPALSAPPPLAAASMVAAGIAWGVYSLRGRGAPDPLGATAANFARAVPMTAVLMIASFRVAHVTFAGAALAVASGALASGVGYSLWYAALRDMAATRAGLVQLGVPVAAAAGGVALLGEHVTLRLVGASVAILGGIAMATLRRRG